MTKNNRCFVENEGSWKIIEQGNLPAEQQLLNRNMLIFSIISGILEKLPRIIAKRLIYIWDSRIDMITITAELVPRTYFKIFQDLRKTVLTLTQELTTRYICFCLSLTAYSSLFEKIGFDAIMYIKYSEWSERREKYKAYVQLQIRWSTHYIRLVSYLSRIRSNLN